MCELFPVIPSPLPVSGLAWVYILQSADGSFYVGQTINLVERLRKHRYGLGSKHTHDHEVPRLIYCEGPGALDKIVARERQIKGWSRAKKVALIKHDISRLKVLARSRGAET
jgi:putative endonuclease